MSRSDDRLEDLDEAALDYARRRRDATGAKLDFHRHAFTLSCLPFARRLARRYRGRGELFEDLEQVARLGLVKAIDRYDPSRGSFTAFAVITINGEIKRHFRDRTWDLHVPRRLQDLGMEVGHATQVMTAAMARTPTVAEVAHHLGVSEAAVLEAMGSAAGYATASLNAPIRGDGSAELGDLIGDADADLERVDDLVTVDSLIRRLPERERQLLTMRFHGNRTQAQIATELGISQMHVSRLLTRALTSLREAMLTDAGPRTGVRAGDLRIAMSESGGTVVVTVQGEVDRDNAQRLRIGLRQAIARASGAVVVDMRGVPLVDAAGIAVLTDVASAAALARVALRLTGVQRYVAMAMAAG